MSFDYDLDYYADPTISAAEIRRLRRNAYARARRQRLSEGLKREGQKISKYTIVKTGIIIAALGSLASKNKLVRQYFEQLKTHIGLPQKPPPPSVLESIGKAIGGTFAVLIKAAIVIGFPLLAAAAIYLVIQTLSQKLEDSAYFTCSIGRDKPAQFISDMETLEREIREVGFPVNVTINDIKEQITDQDDLPTKLCGLFYRGNTTEPFESEVQNTAPEE